MVNDIDKLRELLDEYVSIETEEAETKINNLIDKIENEMEEKDDTIKDFENDLTELEDENKVLLERIDDLEDEVSDLKKD